MDNLPVYHLELVRDYSIPTQPMKSVDQIYSALHQVLDRSLVEEFVVMHLDAHQNLLGLEKVAKGSLTSVHVKMQDVFRGALIRGADGIVIAHNHSIPESPIMPSDEDYILTSCVVECATILGIRLYDHIIVSPNGESYSMYQNVHAMNKRLNDIKLKHTIDDVMKFIPPTYSPIPYNKKPLPY